MNRLPDDNVLANAVIDSVVMGQRVEFYFEGSISKGSRILEIATYGLAEDSKLHVFRRAVKVFASSTPAPTITEVHSDDRPDGKVTDFQKLYVTGSNLEGASIECYANNVRVAIPESATITTSANSIVIDNGDTDVPIGGETDQEFKVVVTTAGGSVTFTTEIG